MWPKDTQLISNHYCLFEGGVTGIGSERKEGRGFFSVDQHCSQPRTGGRDERGIFSQEGGEIFI